MAIILVKSQFLQTVYDDKKENAVVYHSLFGYPQILNEDAIDLLNAFTKPTSISKVIALDSFVEAEKTIQTFQRLFFLVPPNFDERGYIQKISTERYLPAIQSGERIEYLSLILSEQCNFACQYCMSNSMLAASDRHLSIKKIMSKEMAQNAVDIFFAEVKKNGKNSVYINFGGGEPLINWDTMLYIMKYCVSKYAEIFLITFTINTNGSLIDESIAAQLKCFGVKIALSLDGLEQGNNAVRMSRSGQGTYSSITQAMETLVRANYGINGISTTVTEKNFYDLDDKFIDFAIKRSLNEVRIDIDVIHMTKIPVQEAANRLLCLKRYGKNRGVNITGFWERPAENLNFSITEKHMGFCGGIVGKSMCVSPDGKVYICGYSTNAYADVTKDCSSMATSKYIEIVTNRLLNVKKECKNCQIEGQCTGGCLIAEEFSDLETDNATSYNCQLFRIMTNELLRDSLAEVEATSES
jgi:uncharacterized protein